MAMPDTKRHKKKYLDGEVLFEYYWGKMGQARNFAALQRYCVAQGWVNPVLGTAPGRMTLFKAVYRWATKKENFEKGYEIVQAGQRDVGNFMSRDEWKQHLRDRVKSAWQFAKDRHLQNFLRKNDYI